MLEILLGGRGEVKDCGNPSGTGVFDLEIWLGGMSSSHGNLNSSRDQRTLAPLGMGGGVGSPLYFGVTRSVFKPLVGSLCYVVA